MKSFIATLLLSILFFGTISAQYYPYPSPPPAPESAAESTALGGTCGMYLAACCPGDSCNRGFVCTSGLSSEPVCFTPRCTETQQCLSYAYWTECIVDQMNCNACGFIGQKCCSLQSGPIVRDQPCYQGTCQGGYCAGEEVPAPPSYYPEPVYEPYPAPPSPTYEASPSYEPYPAPPPYYKK